MNPQLLILLLTGTLVPGFFGWGLYDWKKRKPAETIHSVGVRYLPDAVKPWPGLKEAIDAAWDAVVTLYPNEGASIMNHLWLEVVPYAGIVTSPTLPTGFVGLADDKSRATGTSRVERAMGVGKKYYCVVCRQLRAGDSHAQNLAATGTGEILSAGESAFFHELAQHIVPAILFDDWNFKHSRGDMQALELAMSRRYAEARGQAAPTECATCSK